MPAIDGHTVALAALVVCQVVTSLAWLALRKQVRAIRQAHDTRDTEYKSLDGRITATHSLAVAASRTAATTRITLANAARQLAIELERARFNS